MVLIEQGCIQDFAQRGGGGLKPVNFQEKGLSPLGNNNLYIFGRGGGTVFNLFAPPIPPSLSLNTVLNSPLTSFIYMLGLRLILLGQLFYYTTRSQRKKLGFGRFLKIYELSKSSKQIP